MSVLRIPLLRDFGSACERILDRWSASAHRGQAGRKPRRLTIDSLEQRMLLSVSPTNVNEVLINQALVTPPLVTTATSGAPVATIPWYLDAAANAGKSVAMDDNGDFVVTWQSVDTVAGFIDPATGNPMTDSNIYARYFTDAMQRLNLPASATSFALQFNGSTIEKLTISLGTPPAGFFPLPLDGAFKLNFTDKNNVAHTATVNFSEFGSNPLVTNAQNIQDALRGMGAVELSEATVSAVDMNNYVIDFGDPSVGLSQAPKIIATDFADLGGFYPAIDFTIVRQSGTTIAIPISRTNPAITAQNIEYAFLYASQNSAENLVGPITFPAAGEVSATLGSPVGPYYTPDVLRVGLPSVQVTARSATEFDITFTGDMGKLQQPLLVPLNATTLAPLAGATVTIIKQSSDTFRVNAPEPDDPSTIRPDIYDQTNPQVAMDSDGDFVITWQSVVPDSQNLGSFTDIFARRFSAAGYVPQWDSMSIGSLPSSAFVADMNLLDRAGTPDTLIQGVRPLGSEFQVNTTTTNPQAEPSVGVDGDGNFTIAWMSRGQGLSVFNTIAAQRYDRDGNRLGGEFIVNSADTTTMSFAPYVAMSEDGVLAIAWSESNDPRFVLWREAGSTAGSFVKVYDAKGAMLVDEQSLPGWVPTVDFDAADNFVVSYTYTHAGSDDHYGDDNDNVYAQEFQVYAPGTKTLAFFNIRTEFRLNSASFDPSAMNLWPLEQQNAQVALDADGDLTASYGSWRSSYYGGYGPDVSENILTNSQAVAALQRLINTTTNADLLPYFNPVNGISNYITYGSNGDVDGVINQVIISGLANSTSITPEQAGRLRSILESVAGLMRGEANSAMYSQFDGPIGNTATSNILSSDDIANNHRDGSDASYILAINTGVTSGTLTLLLGTPNGGGAVTSGNVSHFTDGAFDPALTLEDIHNILSNLSNTGGADANWPQDGGNINNGPFQGTVAVRQLSDEEVLARVGTPWDLSADVDPAAATPYAVYEITFMGELHDTPISLSIRRDQLTYPESTEDPPPENPVSSVCVAETLGDPGTLQYDPSIAMDRSGNFVMVWNEAAQNSSGVISNTNLYYRQFQESTDTAGPLATDFLLPTGDRLKANATVRQQLSYMVVTFDEDMMTTGPNSVTNPNNWAVMKDGVLLTGGISQIYYGMNEAATRLGAPASNKWEAVLVLNGSGNSQTTTPYLLNGHYQIVATTALRDKAGNALGRTGYTPNGITFSRAFDVSLPTGTEVRVNANPAGNQYTNPSDEIQQITFRPTASPAPAVLAGSFTLSIGAYTSGSINFDSSNLAGVAAAVQAELDWAGYHGAVVTAQANGSAYVLTTRFGGVDTAIDQPTIGISINSALLAASASVVEIQKGIAVPPPQATASDANGDYVTVWTSDTPGSAGLYAKVYAANWTNTNGVRQANPSTNPTEILVTALSGTRNYQGTSLNFYNATYASVACDAAGDFVVTWSEQDMINGQLDWNVWAQRYGASQTLVGTPFMVNTTTADVQAYSSVAMDALGGIVITWQSLNQDGSGWGVYGQRFNASGLPLGGQNEAQLMTVAGSPTGGTFTLNWNGQNTAAITYDASSLSGTAAAIQAQLRNIGASGVVVTSLPGTTQFAIEFSGLQGDQDQPQVTVTSANLSGGTNPKITIETSIDGAAGEFRVNDTTVNNQMFPSIAMNGSGAFVISWTGYGQDGDLAYESNVYAKTYESSADLDLASHRISNVAQYKISPSNPLASANLIVSTDAIGNHVVPAGTGYDGVVEIDAQGLGGAWMGSGALLLDGRHILTAAHVVYDDIAGAPVTSATVSFDLPTGRVQIVATQITINPGYDPLGIGVNDIAIITLPQIAPAGVQRYDIYRSQDELGKIVDIYGYGATGQGLTGDIGPAGTKHTGENTLELLGDVLNGMALTAFGFPFTDVINIPAGSMLLFDFDDGTATHDAFGQLFATSNLGLGAKEAAQAHGDSGGPVFINGMIAGIVDIGLDPTVTDVDGIPSDSSFGSILGDVRVSYYASWIDGVLGGPVGSAEFRVNETIAADQKWSSAAIDAAGNFAITWTSFGQDGGGNGPGNGVNGLNSVYVRRYSATGTAVSGEFQANTYTADNQQYSRIAMNAAGDFTVVWESYQDRSAFNGGALNPADAANSFGIFGQKYVRNSLVGVPVYPGGPTITGPNGELETEFEANSTIDGDQRYPSIAMDDNGDFLVVWSGNGMRPGHVDSQGVFMQRFDKPTDTAGPRAIETFNSTTAPRQLVLESGNINTAVTTFVVAFSEALSQVGGPGGAHSITNLNNWSIARNGVTIANGIASVQYVGYNATTHRYEANITFDSDALTAGTQALGAGDYVLTVNGVVQDLFGTNLDGNADGTPGDSFSRKFTIGTGGGSGGSGGGSDVPGPGTPPSGSSDTPISLPIVGGGSPAVASDAAGNSVLVWADAGLILAQRLDYLGQTAGMQFVVNTTAFSIQSDPDVAMDANGNFIVVWSGSDINGYTTVYGRLFDSTGKALGSQFLVAPTMTTIQQQPSVARDVKGDFAVTWTRYNQVGDKYGNIVGRFFDSTGKPITGEFAVSTTLTRSNEFSDVAIADNGNIAVTWQSQSATADGWDIYGQRISAAGSKLGGEFRVNNSTSNIQISPHISADATGNYVIVWQSYLQDGSDYGVYARRYSAAGAALDGNEVRINETVLNRQYQPDVAVARSGGYTIVWTAFGQDDLITKDYGIYARMYNADGSSAASEFRINATTRGDQITPAVSRNATNGNYTVVWTSPSGIFARAVGVSSSSNSSSNNSANSNQTASVGSATAIGVYNPASSTFYLRNTPTTGTADAAFAYGAANSGWITITGDWDGDGKDTIGMYDPSTSRFYLRNSNDAGYATISFVYGPANGGWKPIVGDWDGDGKDTIGLYNPTASTFYLRNSNTSGTADAAFNYGAAGAGWTPLAGDWDGDGTDTIGVYNPTASVFYLRNTNDAGYANLAVAYGPAKGGWTPLVGDWDNNGSDTVGLYNPKTSNFYLRNSNTSGVADVSFAYGAANSGWAPLVGNWTVRRP